MKLGVQTVLGNKWLDYALRYALGFIFVYAAVEKVAQPEDFARAIANYHILPFFAINIFAVLLPWIELLTGIALIGKVNVRVSALLIIAMLVVFIVAITIALVRGLDISCGCFGTASASKVGLSRLLEDIVMLIAAVGIYVSPRNRTLRTSAAEIFGTTLAATPCDRDRSSS